MKIENRLNCQNCGAPRTGTICEYCGTVFYDLNYIQAKQSEIEKIKAEINAEINKVKFENSLYAMSSCWFPDYRRF